MEKAVLVDAIIGSGAGLGSIDYCVKMEKIGLAEFCGNQWNEEWGWKRDELLKLDISELENIYSRRST